MEIKEIKFNGYGSVPVVIAEKTAVIDTATSFSEKDVLDGLKEILNGRSLDYIFLTHSHFDHVGNISAIRKTYPNVIVIGSEKCAKVFQSEGAKSFMDYMTKMLNPSSSFDTTGLYVDRIVHDGDQVDMGDTSFTIIETKGHTDCCISFYSEDEKLIFASESLGVWLGKGPISMEMCKGYRDVIASIEKIRKLDPKKLYLSHTGPYTHTSIKEYLDKAEEQMLYYKDIVYTELANGKTDDEIAEICKNTLYQELLDAGITDINVNRWLVNTKAFIAFARKTDFS